MRKINTWHHVSADGFFAGADGGLDWIVEDREVLRAALVGIGALVFGRKTYEMFAARWQRVLAQPNPRDPHSTDELLELAQAYTDLPKVVFSRTLDKPSWPNTRIVRELEPRGIARMKQDAGKDLLVAGSASIVELLTAHGLIDEYQFVISPTLLRDGRKLMPGGSRTQLRLVETRSFPTGCLLVRYTRA